MAECVLTLGSSEEQSLRASVTITVLMETAGLLSDTKLKEEEEINRLETALNLAKEKNRNTVMKKNTLDIDIAAAVKTVEVRRSAYKIWPDHFTLSMITAAPLLHISPNFLHTLHRTSYTFNPIFFNKQTLQEDLKAATNQKSSLLSSLQKIEKDSAQLTVKSSKSAQEKVSKGNEMERQTSLRTSLERRNTQLDAKRRALENTLIILEKERDAKESETFLERIRILQKKKDTEEKAFAANQKLLAEYREITNMESSIRSREREVEVMEQERNRLIKQVALEREKAEQEKLSDTEIKSRETTRSNSDLDGSSSTSTDSPPPNQKLNPFSTKEKYGNKAIAPTTTSKKFTDSAQKKSSTWRSMRDPSDFQNYNNFYF